MIDKKEEGPEGTGWAPEAERRAGRGGCEGEGPQDWERGWRGEGWAGGPLGECTDPDTSIY